jgi:leucyl aminopeptidase
MKVRFSQNSPEQQSLLVAVISEGAALPQVTQEIERRCDGYVSKAMRASGFRANLGSRLALYVPMADSMRRVVLLGAGDADALGHQRAMEVGEHLFDTILSEGVALADVCLCEPMSTPALAAQLAYGARLRSYYFDRYKTDRLPRPLEIHLRLSQAEQTRQCYFELDAIAAGVELARDLGNEPPNVLSPMEFARRCKQLEEHGLAVQVLDADELRKLGMLALLGVGQGSEAPPCVVVVQWNGAGRADDPTPLAFVGKGVTFDTGGLLPKGPEEMWDMKYDMCGAAAVVGAMRALAGRRAPVNAVGVVGLVENMPSGRAQRPGDIVRSFSGQTIEVLHTDAEGRLVLADLLSYTRQRFAPRAMINVATLTGSMTTVLGHEYAGLYSNDQDLIGRLLRAGETTGERLWHLPLCEAFDRMLDSPYADVQNICKTRLAGSATAAQFLKRFVADTRWAHVDMLSTAWKKQPSGATSASGFGVKLLNAFVAPLESQRE